MATLPSSPAATPLVAPALSGAQLRAWRIRMHYTTLLLALAVVILSGALRLHGLNEVDAPWYGALPNLCAWRQMFGVNCPGCGLTRSFVALAHGRPGDAWLFNPAGFLLFAVVLYQIPFRAVQLWRLRTGREDYRHGPWTVAVTSWVLVAALVGQWVWRLW